MTNQPLRILVITLAPWNVNNVTGSTASSFFQYMDNIEVANIFARPGDPDNDIVSRYFQITDQMLLNALVHGGSAGKEYRVSSTKINPTNDVFNRNRRRKGTLFYWAEECLWLNHRWKSSQLDDFISKFHPDIIWSPIYYRCFMNRLTRYIATRFKLPLVSFISDDNYTLKQFSLSPLFWIDRLIKRHSIKKIIQQSAQLYVISNKMKAEYDRIFGIHSLVLTKGSRFECCPDYKHEGKIINLTYIGGLGFNRWKSLSELIQVVSSLNHKYKSTRLFLNIYSNAAINERILSKLTVSESSKFYGALEQDKITKTYADSDILVHVEPKSLKYRLFYRLSFSTKLVDCFAMHRAILTYGGLTGSTEYLKQNAAALVCQTKLELYKNLENIVSNPDMLEYYADQAFLLGKNKHNSNVMIPELRDNLEQIALNG